MALLVEAGAYAMHLRRWQILESIDGFQINVIGKVEGELKENIVVYDDVISEKDVIQFLSKTKIALLSQPPFIPSGLGFTVFDAMGANALTMIEERFSAKTFFKPGEEVITYHPMDSYYLSSNGFNRNRRYFGLLLRRYASRERKYSSSWKRKSF